MSTNSSNEAGKDAIKGGIFFGSNLTPTGTFENIPQFMNSLKIVFIIFTFLCIIGVFASLARGKKKD